MKWAEWSLLFLYHLYFLFSYFTRHLRVSCSDLWALPEAIILNLQNFCFCWMWFVRSVSKQLTTSFLFTSIALYFCQLIWMELLTSAIGLDVGSQSRVIRDFLFTCVAVLPFHNAFWVISRPLTNTANAKQGIWHNIKFSGLAYCRGFPS